MGYTFPNGQNRPVIRNDEISEKDGDPALWSLRAFIGFLSVWLLVFVAMFVDHWLRKGDPSVLFVALFPVGGVIGINWMLWMD